METSPLQGQTDKGEKRNKESKKKNLKDCVLGGRRKGGFCQLFFKNRKAREKRGFLVHMIVLGILVFGGISRNKKTLQI